jgi:hypothetical protein
MMQNRSKTVIRAATAIMTLLVLRLSGEMRRTKSKLQAI